MKIVAGVAVVVAFGLLFYSLNKTISEIHSGVSVVQTRTGQIFRYGRSTDSGMYWFSILMNGVLMVICISILGISGWILFK
jgi:hypothetical protein